MYWEPFEINTQLYLNIGIKPKLKSHYRGHKLALWLNLIPQIHLSGGSEVALNHHTFNDDNPKHYIGKTGNLFMSRMSSSIMQCITKYPVASCLTTPTKTLRGL